MGDGLDEGRLRELLERVTPGPWHVSEADDRTINGPSMHKQELDPAIYSSFVAATDALADAELVALAPTLARALLRLTSTPTNSDRSETRDAHYARCHGLKCPCFLEGIATSTPTSNAARQAIAEVRRWYDESIFPPRPPGVHTEVYDGEAAAVARKACDNILAKLDELPTSNASREGGGDG